MENQGNLISGEVLDELIRPNEAKQPKVVVIACGGAGTNILATASAASPHFDEKIDFHVVDTSLADMAPMRCNPTVHKIGELGSGKNRDLNRGAISKYLRIHEKELLGLCGDITILCFSAAGGSGAVIAELLTAKLLEDPNKAVIHLTILSDASRVDTMNCIEALKVFNNMVKTDKGYLAVMPYYNPSQITPGSPKTIEEVNHAAAGELIRTIDMFTCHKIGALDINDKVTALRPTRFGDNYLSGYWAMSVATCRADIPREHGEEIHTLIVSGYEPSSIDLIANACYPAKANEAKYIGAIGYPFPELMLKALKNAKVRYESANVQADTTIDSMF